MRLHNDINHRRRHHDIVKRESLVESLERRQKWPCWFNCPPQHPNNGIDICKILWCPPGRTTTRTTAHAQTTSTRSQTTQTPTTQRPTTAAPTQAPSTRQTTHTTNTPAQQQPAASQTTAPVASTTTYSVSEGPTTTTQTDNGAAAATPEPVTSSDANVQIKPQTTSYYSTFTDAFGIPYGLDETGGIHELPTSSGVPKPGINPPPNAAGATSVGNSVGGIVGGIIGAIAFLVILIFCTILIRKRQRSRRVAPSSEFVGRSPASSVEWRTRTSPFQRIASPVDPPMPAYGSAYYGDSYTGTQSPQPRFRDDRANSPQSFLHY